MNTMNSAEEIGQQIACCQADSDTPHTTGGQEARNGNIENAQYGQDAGQHDSDSHNTARVR